jgi:hypothetical protein
LGSCLEWYQIKPATATSVQAGSFGFTKAYVYAPWIVVNSSGSVVIPFESSSSTTYVSADYAGRFNGDPKNLLQSTVYLLKSGAGYYQRAGGKDEFGNAIIAPGLRSAGDVDPDNDNLFWIYGAYALGLNGTCPNNTPDYDWATEFGVATFAGANVAKVDTTPPEITISATPATLWPPNGDMVTVTVSGTMMDDPEGTGVNPSTPAYTIKDEYGQVQPQGNITLGSDGSYTFTTQLQASRSGNDKKSRRYAILVSAQDNAGNKGVAAALVTVSHNQSS